MLVNTKARIGVFAIAHGPYLPQFPQLVAEYAGQYEAFKKTIPDTVEIIDGGLVTNKELAMAAGDKFRAADVDLVFLQMLTYATSYNVLPAIRDLDVPVVVINVQKLKAPDYANTDVPTWLGELYACGAEARPWPTSREPASVMLSSPAWSRAATPTWPLRSPTGARPLRFAVASATPTSPRSAVPTPA